MVSLLQVILLLDQAEWLVKAHVVMQMASDWLRAPETSMAKLCK